MEYKESPVCFRATAEDQKLLDSLRKKLGIGTSQVIKLALRRLYDLERRK